MAAGRFLFQKFSSGVSRSISSSLLGVHASASARAGAPFIPRAAESGSRTLSNLFHGAAIHPGMAAPHNYGIHGYAARYLNTVPCCHAVAKIAWPTTGMPSIVINRKKSAFVDSVRGVRRIFSSAASNKHGHSWKARLAAWVTEKRRRGNKADTETRNMMFMIAWIAYCLLTWPAPRSNNSQKGSGFGNSTRDIVSTSMFAGLCWVLMIRYS